MGRICEQMFEFCLTIYGKGYIMYLTNKRLATFAVVGFCRLQECGNSNERAKSAVQ